MPNCALAKVVSNLTFEHAYESSTHPAFMSAYRQLQEWLAVKVELPSVSLACNCICKKRHKQLRLKGSSKCKL
jgi:hypothetical protein